MNMNYLKYSNQSEGVDLARKKKIRQIIFINYYSFQVIKGNTQYWKLLGT